MDEARTHGPSRRNKPPLRGKPSTSQRGWKIDGRSTITCSTAEPGIKCKADRGETSLPDGWRRTGKTVPQKWAKGKFYTLSRGRRTKQSAVTS